MTSSDYNRKQSIKTSNDKIIPRSVRDRMLTQSGQLWNRTQWGNYTEDNRPKTLPLKTSLGRPSTLTRRRSEQVKNSDMQSIKYI